MSTALPSDGGGAGKGDGRRRLVYLLPVLLFVGVAMALGVGLTRDPEQLPSALLDRPAPALDLPPIQGGDRPGLASADLKKGKGPVLVNFFASWCAPCRIEHPIVSRLAEEGWTVLGINYKDKPEDARAWLGNMGDPYARIGADQKGLAGIDWGITGVPETFILDRNGRIVWRFQGPLQPRELERDVLPLLKSLAP
ncbi:MAG: DsbE family thiol:disulfide interchange protein [Geminicoccaceae bacterium]|nr:DsbE family thiol:disulfide interchange protein [Geminicoccaceae bacterium]